MDCEWLCIATSIIKIGNSFFIVFIFVLGCLWFVVCLSTLWKKPPHWEKGGFLKLNFDNYNYHLFCDTTERKADCTIVAVGRDHEAEIEVQAERIGAILRTTPVVAVAATAVERASGAEAEASCSQSE